MVLVLVGKDYFAILFTNSKEMQRAVANLAWLLGITMVLNSVQPVISGLLSILLDFLHANNGTDFVRYFSIFFSSL